LWISYRIFETDQFNKDLVRLKRGGRGDISKKLIDQVYPQLKVRPHYGLNIKKLRDFEPETWRYRIGSWRFFYEIDEPTHIVFMTAAAHRSRAY
jgi:mRNA interferase RelE/StbE